MKSSKKRGKKSVRRISSMTRKRTSSKSKAKGVVLTRSKKRSKRAAQAPNLGKLLGYLGGGGAIVVSSVIGQWYVLNDDMEEVQEGLAKTSQVLERVNDSIQEFKLEYTRKTVRLERCCDE